MSKKIIVALILASVPAILAFVLSYFRKKKNRNRKSKKEVKINKKTNKISSRVGKGISSIEITGSNGNKIEINFNDNHYYNTCDNFPNEDKITSPNAVIKSNKKDQKEELKKEEIIVRQNQTESKEQWRKEQEMPQQKYERLLMKVKFIAFGIMGNIKWDKVKPLDFWKEKDKEFAQLVFKIEKKWCWIAYEITEKDKQRFWDSREIYYSTFNTLRKK